MYLSHEHGHGQHIEGYLAAAQLLHDQMEGGDFANTLLFPRVYLLRHAAELALKEAIQKKLGSGAPKELWRTHDLAHLAHLFRDTWTEVLDEDVWTEYHDFLLTWEAADPGGTFFRYCRDRDGRVVEVDSTAWITANKVGKRAREAVQIVQGIAEL